MHLFRYLSPGGPRLGLVLEGANYDLTSTDESAFAGIASWLSLPDPVDAARQAAEKARDFPISDFKILAPLDEQEVWACGVTYLRSKVARMEESEGGGDFYDLVYDAERPELFFKANPCRVSAFGEAIRIRADSTWDVPEPELCLVLSSRGEIVGHTIGNDVSSRSIEGENPLYLPQAKVFDGACAIGPVIALDGERERAIRLTISRGSKIVFEGETSTAQMRRTPQELAAYLFRELTFPQGVFLLTGTGVVPGDNFTLQSGDVVTIEIEGIGALENFVQ